MTERQQPPPQHQLLQLSGQAYHNFVDSIRSKESKIQYTYALKKYMVFLKVSEVDHLLSRRDHPLLIQSDLQNFIVTLRDKDGLSYSAINGYKGCAITKFYVMNDVLLNDKKISSYLGENVRKNTDRCYTIGEIHWLLEISDECMKVIVLLLFFGRKS